MRKAQNCEGLVCVMSADAIRVFPLFIREDRLTDPLHAKVSGGRTMQGDQAGHRITASGQRRRNRRKKMKRLGLEQVTLFVPKGEV